jgi:pyruvate kinase
MIRRIVDQAEAWATRNLESVELATGKLEPAYAFARGVAEVSKSTNTRCILVIEDSGVTTERISQFRPHVPIVAFVPNAKLGRLLQLRRGVYPVVSLTNLTSESSLSNHESFDIVVAQAKSLGFCKSGDDVIIVAADRASSAISAANIMKVVRVL